MVQEIDSERAIHSYTGKKTVVVLEDNAAIGELLEFLLIEQGMNVRLFDRIAAFQNSTNAFQADLYLLDIMLPDGDGHELCRNLKADEKTSHIPVILMSAHFDDIQVRCDAQGFIRKPFDIDELVNKVKGELK